MFLNTAAFSAQLPFINCYNEELEKEEENDDNEKDEEDVSFFTYGKVALTVKLFSISIVQHA